MKRFALIIVALAFAGSVFAESFEHWMKRVYRLAPAYDLQLHPRDPRYREGEQEWFYLYYFQGNFTPREAVMATVDHQKHCAACQSWKQRKE